jgi:hypothetical protein
MLAKAIKTHGKWVILWWFNGDLMGFTLWL